METKNNPKDDWDDHWKKYSDSASENPAQKYRFKLILDELRRNQSFGAINFVDIGCGQGDLLLEVKRTFPGFNLLGLELSHEGVNIVKKKTGIGNIFQADLLGYSNELNTFHGWADIAVCTEVLEHVDDPVLFLKTSMKFLKTRGMLIITLPGGPMSIFDKSIGHRQHFNKETSRQLFKDAGIKNVDIYHAGFPWHNLYRLVVILRGHKLEKDVNKESLSRVAIIIMRMFSFLFRFNLKKSRWGWQNFVVAWKE